MKKPIQNRVKNICNQGLYVFFNNSNLSKSKNEAEMLYLKRANQFCWEIQIEN